MRAPVKDGKIRRLLSRQISIFGQSQDVFGGNFSFFLGIRFKGVGLRFVDMAE